jgi:hypothetical protein
MLVKIITTLLYVGMLGIGIWYIGTYGVEIVIGFGCVMAIYFLNAIKEFINEK